MIRTLHSWSLKSSERFCRQPRGTCDRNADSGLSISGSSSDQQRRPHPDGSAHSISPPNVAGHRPGRPIASQLNAKHPPYPRPISLARSSLFPLLPPVQNSLVPARPAGPVSSVVLTLSSVLCFHVSSQLNPKDPGYPRSISLAHSPFPQLPPVQNSLVPAQPAGPVSSVVLTLSSLLPACVVLNFSKSLK